MHSVVVLGTSLSLALTYILPRTEFFDRPSLCINGWASREKCGCFPEGIEPSTNLNIHVKYPAMDYGHNYAPNYFSIDDIAATEERVVCKFEQSILKMGSLDPSSDSPDILPGTKLELPFWLASFLFRQRIVTIEVPKYYKDYYREILNADPSVVDLSKWGPHYYELGLHLQRMNIREQTDIRNLLYDALRVRTRNILDSSLHSRREEHSSIASILDSLEKKLFEAGREASRRFDNWLTGESERIQPTAMVEKARKRKLDEMKSD